MKRIKLTNRIIEYILKCKPLDFHDLNVNAIAGHFNVSVPHLSRDFKKNMKICLHEYILREKIKRACFLLKQNLRLTVKEVSRILDFCSCDYFIRVFKKYVGTTPGEFRKMDKGFYGLCDRRKGSVDRRSGVKDRRSNSSYMKVKLVLSIDTSLQFPNNKELRYGSSDRRKGLIDRRRVFHQPRSEF